MWLSRNHSPLKDPTAWLLLGHHATKKGPQLKRNFYETLTNRSEGSLTSTMIKVFTRPIQHSQGTRAFGNWLPEGETHSHCLSGFRQAARPTTLHWHYQRVWQRDGWWYSFRRFWRSIWSQCRSRITSRRSRRFTASFWGTSKWCCSIHFSEWSLHQILSSSFWWLTPCSMMSVVYIWQKVDRENLF